MSALPTLVPTPTDTLLYRPLVSDSFQYALNIDETTWEAWSYSVEVETTFYAVSENDTANVNLFSEFLIYFKCNTVQDKDACCMKSESHGTVCLIPSTTGTVMETWRFTKAEWDTDVIGVIDASPRVDADSSATVDGADYWF